VPLTGASSPAPITLVKGAYIIPEIGQLAFKEDGAGDDEGGVTYFDAQWKINF
jgi:hypothetical protein